MSGLISPIRTVACGRLRRPQFLHRAFNQDHNIERKLFSLNHNGANHKIMSEIFEFHSLFFMKIMVEADTYLE